MVHLERTTPLLTELYKDKYSFASITGKDGTAAVAYEEAGESGLRGCGV